jgi:ribonuclease VapC
MMFVDRSVFVSIISREEDGEAFFERLSETPDLKTSAMVMLEAVMRLSTKLSLPPSVALSLCEKVIDATKMKVVPITRADGIVAIQAFERYGKGRGQAAQLNFADCML